jgi:hypothetical protein
MVNSDLSRLRKKTAHCIEHGRASAVAGAWSCSARSCFAWSAGAGDRSVCLPGAARSGRLGACSQRRLLAWPDHDRGRGMAGALVCRLVTDRTNGGTGVGGHASSRCRSVRRADPGCRARARARAGCPVGRQPWAGDRCWSGIRGSMDTVASTLRSATWVEFASRMGLPMRRGLMSRMSGTTWHTITSLLSTHQD